MEEIQKEVVVPEQEKQQEEELLKEVQVDEVRQSIIEKFNLDNEIDEDLINKLVENETETRKTLSKAISQKRNWREKAMAKNEPKNEEVIPQSSSKPLEKVNENDIDKVINQKLSEKFDEQKLNSVDIDDDVKKEIKSYAKAAQISIDEALKSDFFVFKKEKYDARKRLEEASISGSGSGSSIRQGFDVNNPPDVDLTTVSGQKTWEDYKAWIKTQK